MKFEEVVSGGCVYNFENPRLGRLDLIVSGTVRDGFDFNNKFAVVNGKLDFDKESRVHEFLESEWKKQMDEDYNVKIAEAHILRAQPGEQWACGYEGRKFSPASDKTAKLAWIGVRPPFVGEGRVGLGRATLSGVANYLPALGCDSVIASSLQTAKGFYRHLGFDVTEGITHSCGVHSPITNPELNKIEFTLDEKKTKIVDGIMKDRGFRVDAMGLAH
jgi:hypothetical protein